MLESFLYSWAWKGACRSWLQVKAEAAPWRSYLARGGRLLALSYLGNTDRAPEEDALFSFAAATLLGHLWSDYGTLKSGPFGRPERSRMGDLGTTLRTLRLGKGLTALAPGGAVEYRFFERGLVAINDDSGRRTAAVPACPRFGFSRLRNLADGSEVKCRNGAWPLALPPHSGRVYIGVA